MKSKMRYRQQRFDCGSFTELNIFPVFECRTSPTRHARRKPSKQAQQALNEASREEEWLRYQVEELRAAALKEDEESQIEAQIATLANAESITEAYGAMHLALTDEQTGILTQLSQRTKALKTIAPHYADAQQAAERLNSVIIELQDLDATAQSVIESVESDPEQLEKLNNRMQTILSLRRKHRAESVAELIKIYNDYAAKLSIIDLADQNIANLEVEVQQAEKQATDIAQKIYEAHKAATTEFESSVDAILHKVGMAEACFKIGYTEVPLNATGIEQIEFLFSANSGVVPRAVDKIASGGELSRVMLALKAIISRTTALPTIIFDEIDTGVSGSVANAVGEVIAELSATMQVIDITHLPQVASKGDRNYLVYKSESTTYMRELSKQERVTEIAKMLSGDQITNAAIEQAKILLGLQ